MIAGSPEVVEAAADDAQKAGRDLGEVAEDVSQHGQAATNQWEGVASDAALRHISALAASTRVGGDVLALLGPVLRTYAVELRTAQREYAHGQAVAAAGAAALGSAQAAATAAGAMQADDPQRSLATQDAADAVSAATTQKSEGAADMAAAVQRAAVANDAAARAVNDLTGQLSGMDATTTTASDAGVPGSGIYGPPAYTSAAMRTTGTEDQDEDGRWRDITGGVGNFFWSATLGTAGKLFERSPTGFDRELGRDIQAAHDRLEEWYGADTTSADYRGSQWLHRQAVGLQDGAVDGTVAAIELGAGLTGADGDGDVAQDWFNLGDNIIYGASHPVNTGKSIVGWEYLRQGEIGYPIGTFIPAFITAYTTGGGAAASRLGGSGDALLDAGGKTAGEAAREAARGIIGVPPIAGSSPTGPPPIPPRYAGLDVENLSGGHVGGWNKRLNKPAKNTVYRVDNRQLYVTDHEGRVEHVSAQLEYRGPISSVYHRNGYQQGASGNKGKRNDRLPIDQGGHLVASSLSGPGEAINLVPMDVAQNGPGTDNWNALETQWRDMLKADPSTDIQIDVNLRYSGDSTRPSAFQVEYTINGGRPERRIFTQ